MQNYYFSPQLSTDELMKRTNSAALYIAKKNTTKNKVINEILQFPSELIFSFHFVSNLKIATIEAKQSATLRKNVILCN